MKKPTSLTPTMTAIPTITLSSVASVYSGKPGKCCCGCSGNHRYAAAHLAWASKDRGYEVTQDEVNDRQVAKVVKIINEAIETQNFDATPDADDQMVSVEVEGRLYIAYLVHA